VATSDPRPISCAGTPARVLASASLQGLLTQGALPMWDGRLARQGFARGGTGASPVKVLLVEGRASRPSRFCSWRDGRLARQGFARVGTGVSPVKVLLVEGRAPRRSRFCSWRDGRFERSSALQLCLQTQNSNSQGTGHKNKPRCDYAVSYPVILETAESLARERLLTKDLRISSKNKPRSGVRMQPTA
jgi:hypothetical protein